VRKPLAIFKIVIYVHKYPGTIPQSIGKTLKARYSPGIAGYVSVFVENYFTAFAPHYHYRGKISF
jgi:hypothetical protein